ncbi:hypothetical protein H2202_002596 [Exophiala xenobiotica]|nr:hypothetical protein H2202_002596 [Exophiala xenobiotica]KAK5190359.1 hypothetical protein LTR92_009761 [Exophiala xenobiotica]KAK5404792.1 hypothetical protein LTR06_009513 [Exophiala xenobiotica]
MAPARKQKGPGTTKPTQSSREAANIVQKRPEPVAVPVEVQQMMLDVFRRAFPFNDNLDVKTVIQEVKGHLFQRDFTSAFAKQEYLDAYALRWSASRALGYSDILLHSDLQQVWLGETAAADAQRTKSANRVACIGGGGGAEVVACAAAARSYSLPHLEVHPIDIADWSSCHNRLENVLCTPPPLSPYASESAKAANESLVASDQFTVHFSQCDILAVEEGRLRGMLANVHLCTIMFTLNELFTTSIARATAFLLALTDAMQPGSWLLVVDSPGSYSEVKLGQGQTKRYPMKWLLDHTLQEVAQAKWKKHVSDDSRWFRLNPSLKYPLELENMRYQIHLYQRVS